MRVADVMITADDHIRDCSVEASVSLAARVCVCKCKCTCVQLGTSEVILARLLPLCFIRRREHRSYEEMSMFAFMYFQLSS